MNSVSLFLEEREEEGRKSIEKQTETSRKLSFETIKVKKERESERERGRERERERDKDREREIER